MLLTIVVILFAMVALTALEIMLFWQLGARDDLRRSSQRALGRSSDAHAGSASDLGTLQSRETKVPPHHRPRARWPPRMRAAAAAIAVAATLGACGSASEQPPAGATTGTAAAATQSADVFGRIPDLVKKAQPSIVTIFSERSDARAETARGVGSGVIYRSDGIILTNHHVVADASRIDVGFADGSRIPGHVTATDPDTDLAVIRVDRSGLPAAEFQKSLPQVGNLAVVLGSPLGFEKTVTAGIVSGLHRAIPGSAAETRSLVDLIQTDAAISPGNSGGAVVDASGHVVGISVAYVPPQQGAVAVGFAIPAATATRVADELLEHGSARHAYLGLQPAALTPDIARELYVTGGGVLVYALAPGGPAAKAGIHPGDVLTAVGGQKITSVEELLAELRQHDPGEVVSISYLRDGETQTAQAQITDRPS
jgi:serine protease DegQ